MLGGAGGSDDGGRVAQLLEQLRRRAGKPPYALPALPTLPQPACEEELARRARALGREPRPVTVGSSSDSFLRAAAAQLPHVSDTDAYVREQRAAVAALAPLATWEQPAPDGWALTMAQPDTAFDARALQLWSLLSDRGVLVLADSDCVEVCAVEGCTDNVTVLLDSAGRWVGVTHDRRDVARRPSAVYCGASPGSVRGSGKRARIESSVEAQPLPPAPAPRDPARRALLRERDALRALLQALDEELQEARPDCFYLVHHAHFAHSRFLAQLPEEEQQLVRVAGWHVVGFGRSRGVFECYQGGTSRLHSEFFAEHVRQHVYPFTWEHVLAWRESGAEQQHAAAELERLLKAVLAFTRRKHARGLQLRNLAINDARALCAIDHPACCITKLDGWVDETMLIHPDRWAALKQAAMPCKALHTGGELRLSPQQLRDALLPRTLLVKHAELDELFTAAG